MLRGREKSLALLRFKRQIVQLIDYATSVQKKKEEGGGLERKASPHAPYEGHITKLEKLHVWAVAKFYSVVFSYCTAEDYGKEMVILYDRYG